MDRSTPVLSSVAPMGLDFPNPVLLEGQARRYFAATRSQHKVENMLDCYSDAVEVHYIFKGELQMTGKTELRQFFQSFVDQLQTVELTEEFVYVTGNEAAVKWKGIGLGKNGRTVEFEGIDVLEFHHDGRIQTLRAYWDPADLAAQLQ